MVKKTKKNIEKQIIKDYNNQIPIKKILSKFSIGNTTLFRILRRNKVPNRRYIIPMKKCEWCGKLFKPTRTDLKHCSNKCHFKWQKGKRLNTGKTHFKKGNAPWNKGKKSVMPTPWNLGKTKITDKRIKAPKTAFKKGMKSPYIGLKFEERYNKEKAEEIKQKIREKTLEQYKRGDFPKQTHTKPEMIFKKELIQLGYVEDRDFFHQKEMFDKFFCDFVFPKQKIVVEVQGDYWHANPLFYPYNPEKPEDDLNKIQVKNIKKDKSKEGYIRKRGWNFIPIWEYDINNNLHVISKALKKIIGTPSPSDI